MLSCTVTHHMMYKSVRLAVGDLACTGRRTNQRRGTTRLAQPAQPWVWFCVRSVTAVGGSLNSLNYLLNRAAYWEMGRRRRSSFVIVSPIVENQADVQL